MKPALRLALLTLTFASPIALLAQDDDGGMGSGAEIIVTASKMVSRAPPVTTLLPYLDKAPAVGLRRQADGAVRVIEIQSDSRDADVRKREVTAMLMSALDLARREGLTLVTGQFEIKEVTRENWRDLFPALASLDDAGQLEDEDDDDYDDDEDENGKVPPGYEDDGQTTLIRLKVRVSLTGSLDQALARINAFAKKVPATGRSVIAQKGRLALTLKAPEQYRDEIQRRIAAAAKHAQEFYGPDYGVSVTGLDREIAWQQVSNTELFLYIPYAFTISRVK